MHQGGLMDSASVVFDRYRLEERIGAGGMGVVWRATDLRLDQLVALKRISLAGVDAEQAELIRARALREARAAARLRGHPHVVATYDVLVDGQDVWLVLEYLPSRSLGALCRQRGRLEIVEVARIGAAVADALAAGHERGIVHRDVTPANVLIAEDGTVKLTDFGISRLTGADQITREGVLSGTIAYLAPEVAATCEYSPASDVFSLGATLYAALEGHPPFGTDDNALRLLNVVRTGIIRPPTSAGALTSLLLRLLELDPVTRPDAATARDLLAQFAHRLTTATEHLCPTDPPTPSDAPPAPGGSGQPPPPVSRPPQPRIRWPRWRLWAPWPRQHRLLALIILTGIGLGTWFGVHALTSAGQAIPVGVPPLPATVGPIALTGDPKAADPCPLINPTWLYQFGTVRIATPAIPNECRVRITSPDGADARLRVDFTTPASPIDSVGNERQQLGQLTIARAHGRQWTRVGWCKNVIVLADRTLVTITANDYVGEKRKKRLDLCALTEVGTATAVNALADHGITYRPGRTDAAGWPGGISPPGSHRTRYVEFDINGSMLSTGLC